MKVLQYWETIFSCFLYDIAWNVLEKCQNAGKASKQHCLEVHEGTDREHHEYHYGVIENFVRYSNYQKSNNNLENFSTALKGLFHPAFLARVVSWLTFVCRHFHGP